MSLTPAIDPVAADRLRFDHRWARMDEQVAVMRTMPHKEALGEEYLEVLDFERTVELIGGARPDLSIVIKPQPVD